MTTIVETAEDIIRILRERPDILAQVRREILTDDLLNLPNQVAELVELVKILQEIQAQQAKTLTEHAETLNDHTNILNDHTNILNDHTQRLDRMENRMNRLLGSDLERRARRIVQGRLTRLFSLRRMRVVHDQFALNGPFMPAVEAAADDGKIDDEQEERLKLTDLIIRARPKPDSPLGPDTDQYVWFSVEISGVIEADDISRAVRSAVALRAMYDANALPAVAGFRIRDEDRARAEEEGVSVFIIPEI